MKGISSLYEHGSYIVILFHDSIIITSRKNCVFILIVILFHDSVIITSRTNCVFIVIVISFQDANTLRVHILVGLIHPFSKYRIWGCDEGGEGGQFDRGIFEFLGSRLERRIERIYWLTKIQYSENLFSQR